MNRSPLFYPLNRGMEADAGGAADLQTDVMRFMAILSLCLVAIFALVQAIPLTPVPPEATPAEPVPDIRPVPVAPEPVVNPAPAPDIVLTHPRPESPSRDSEPVVSLTRPAPQRAVSMPKPEPAPAPTPTALPPDTTPTTPVKKGFTLQFESDDALRRLVDRDAVGLYAFGDSETRRVAFSSGRTSFWAASLPGRIHEMDTRTVPATVVDAWKRQYGTDPGDVKWAVSLPADLTRQLNSILAENEGGVLIIDAAGRLRLEP